MTRDELKEKVRKLISNARTKQAITLFQNWANQENQEQLKSDLAKLMGDLATFERDKLMGTLYPSEANIRQSQIVIKVLDLLGTLDEETPIADTADNEFKLPIKILMLTSNPSERAILNLDKEHSKIALKLQSKQDKFIIILKKAVSSTAVSYTHLTLPTTPYV